MVHPALSTDVADAYARALADRLPDSLLRVSLFGSRARGDFGLRSDFDLMVVVETAGDRERDVVHGLASEWELEHGVDLSTKILDRRRFEELRRSPAPFWRRFLRDERTLWPPMS